MAVGLIPVLVVGGVAYYVTSDDEPLSPDGAATPPVGTKAGQRFGQATVGQLVGGIKSTRPAPTPSTTPTRAAGTRGGQSLPYLQAASGNWSQFQGSSTIVAQKVKEAEAFMKEQYEQLGSEAKKAGAKALNEEFGTELTGEESWEDLSRIGGAAIGAAAGGYIGGPLGAKIGAIMGAYLGVKLEEYLSGAWDKISDWAETGWDEVSNAAEDAYNEVASWF